MRLLAYEPFPDAAFVSRWGVNLVPFDQLLRESDYLTLHLPLSTESRHLMNRETLARMKPSGFLINTARGGLVSEADLLEALKANRLAGAGLDVFEKEPPTAKSPLLDYPGVVATAHTAGVDFQSLLDMAASAARAIAALSRGDWPGEQIVNPEVRERLRW
jgi:phosphoglycerate dehydrogenase-like enzyme